MKKIIAMVALAAAATVASAADTSAFVKYDYDRASGTTPDVSVHTATVGVKQSLPGVYGAVDAGYVVNKLSVDGPYVGENDIWARGYSLGYSNGIAFGKVGVTGRVGYSQVWGSYLGADGHVNRLSLATEASYPVTDTVVGFVGYEHQQLKAITDVGSADSSFNRYTAGAKFALTEKVSMSVAYARGRMSGENTNGLTTAISYKF